MDYAPSAVRALEKLPTDARRRIFTKIDALCTNPRPPGVKQLVGGEGELRLRVGSYRVIYIVIDDVLRVLVLAVGQRKDVYRRY